MCQGLGLVYIGKIKLETSSPISGTYILEEIGANPELETSNKGIDQHGAIMGCVTEGHVRPVDLAAKVLPRAVT
jgi:hypothetical protein